MDNIIYFRGIQLSLKLVVIFQDGYYYKLPMKFGPFHSKGSLEDWKERFLGTFLKNALQITGVTDCTKKSESWKKFDSKEEGIFEPTEPEALARELLGIFIESDDFEGDDEVFGGRFYDWEAELKFDFFGQEAHIVKRSFGPILNIGEFRIWWRAFKKTLRQIAAQTGRMRFRVLKGEYVGIDKHTAEELCEDDDFFEVTTWDPAEYAMEFMKIIFAEWFKKANFSN